MMQCRIADLRCKEVINICTGFRLGFVCDLLLDTVTGCILAIVVPGPCRFFGLFWHEDDFIIPWECIKRIGEDIILVEVDGAFRREKRRRNVWV
jgi:YlmC/YmxH family sporulation protein